MKHSLLAIAVGLAACGGAAAGDAGADGGLTPAEMACGRFAPECITDFAADGGCDFACRGLDYRPCPLRGGGYELTRLTTVQNCGACGRVCTAPAGRVPTCTPGSLGSVCGSTSP